MVCLFRSLLRPCCGARTHSDPRGGAAAGAVGSPVSTELNAEAPAALECAGLRKSFAQGSAREVRAVDDLSLTVRSGETVALLGPSGCGKTTTLRLIAGFEWPDMGRVVIAGREVVGAGTFLPPERRRVGMVFQDYALFPHLTVADNVAYGLENSTVGRWTPALRRPLAALRGRFPLWLARRRRRRSTRVFRRRLSLWRCRTSPGASRTSFPAVRRSASRLRGRWRQGPRCCCWTNPSQTWMRRSAPASGARCVRSCAALPPRPSSLPTIKRRRSLSPIGWPYNCEVGSSKWVRPPRFTIAL